MTGRCYLVRHGQSTWNVEGRVQGQAPGPPLTALGESQARRAATALAADLSRPGERVMVLTSDLVRARQTADVVAAALGAELRVDERLREQGLGRLEGRLSTEAWADVDDHDWTDDDLPVAGGESARQVRDRVAAVLDDVDPATVHVLVSHGDTIRAALAHLAGLRTHEAPWQSVPNGGVARIQGREVSWLRSPGAPGEGLG